jgi:hypothetical protein
MPQQNAESETRFYAVKLVEVAEDAGKKIGKTVEARCKSISVADLLLKALRKELRNLKRRRPAKTKAARKRRAAQKKDLQSDLSNLREIKKLMKKKPALLQKSGVIVSFHEFKDDSADGLWAF